MQLYLLILLFFSSLSLAADSNPWLSCVTAVNYDSAAGSANELRIQDRHGRDITHAGMPLMDWEGFIENPQFRFSLVPPEIVSYPVTIQITAPGSPRLYLFQRHLGEDPYDIRNYLSVHNEEGPLWGVTLTTVNDNTEVFGGVPHDLTNEQLSEIGLSRQVRSFSEDGFPLELHLGIHPDRDGDDETHTVVVEMTDSKGNVYRQDIPVVVCDQDQPDRALEFQFHIDYSNDWDGYLETTEDGLVIKEGQERILNDIAYFFEDMRFDEVAIGECEASVNWTIEDRPATDTNNWAYDSGYYLFITSHSGGGGLAGENLYTRNGETTDFRACGFWGANPRDELSTNVDTRMYLPEDEWWRTTTWIYGEDGVCLGDSFDDPGNGCIVCPDDQAWCAHLRGDIYWPNMHELNHGLAMGNWPRWAQWFWSDTLCVDDDDILMYTGLCQPMYRTDHIVLISETFESNKQSDWGRTLFKKWDYLLMQAIGWELRDTTMLTALAFMPVNLATAAVGLTYSERVEVYGGVPSYWFSVASGTLPPGLSLNAFNGELTGKPTTAGEYPLTIRVQDSDEYNVVRTNGVEREFTVIVNE